jgi:hypothetical protein
MQIAAYNATGESVASAAVSAGRVPRRAARAPAGDTCRRARRGPATPVVDTPVARTRRRRAAA